MARQFNGSSDVLELASAAIVTAYPFTISAWFHLDQLPSTAGDEMAIFQIDDGTGNLNFWTLRADDTADKLQFNSRLNGGTVGVAETANSVSATAWQHAFVIAASATDRTAVLNGDTGNEGTDTSNVTPASIDRTQIGRQGVQNNFFDGRLAEVAVWNIALTEAEGVALSKRFSPALIRPGSIVAYWKIIGRLSPEPNYWDGGNNLAVTGTAVAEHSPIIYPAMPQIITAPAVAAVLLPSLVMGPYRPA